jgi:hypothetical protein
MMIALDQHRDIEFFTIGSMTQDVELAEAVAARAGREGKPISWSVRYPGPGQYARVNDPQHLSLLDGLQAVDAENPLLARFLWHFHMGNGQVMPGRYFRAPNPGLFERERSQKGRIVLSGVSGEVLRAPKYSLQAIEGGLMAHVERSMKSRFGLIRGDRASGSMPERLVEAARNAAECWLGYLREAESFGISDFRMFDYFAIAAQQSRRIELGRDIREACPLTSPRLMDYAFRMLPSQRSSNQFHVSLLSDLFPSLAEIPFSFEVKVESSEIRRDNSRFPMIVDELQGVPGFQAILSEQECWRDAYDLDLIHKIYINGKRAVNDYQRDRVACQLAWRVTSIYYSKMLKDHVSGS